MKGFHCQYSLFLIVFLFLANDSKVRTERTITDLEINKKRFEWTPDLKSAYRKVMSLRFISAESELNAIRQNDPDNLMVLHVENYLDFMRVYINEQEPEFNRLEKNKDRRINKISAEGDPSSPYYLFLQADIRLQWALARLKFDQYPTAFFETNKAFRLLSRNAKLFPDFMPNKKDLGLLYAVVGTIPDNYKWAVNWLSSLEGTLDQGKAALQEVINYARKNDFIYEEEIYIYYTYLLLHLDNDSEEAWKVIKASGLKADDSPMSCFILANLAMRTDRGDEAIAILKHRPKGSEFHPFHYLDFMYGLAKLQRLDTDADLYLRKFVDNFRGKNFIKEAYQKLAWACLLKGDRAGYDSYMGLCKLRGNTIVGSDRNAMEEAKNREIPLIDLLKARLLFDGGHFQQAYQLLSNKKNSDYFSLKNQLELIYRLGRISQKLKRWPEAHAYYEETINKGKDETWYFACRAALEKGLLYEQQNNYSSAKKYYQLCLSLSPNDHKTGLHQQAKAGLRRLKN